jgi:hypothetical protein
MQHFVKDTILGLARAQVEFVVVGGISAVLQGVPVVTVDLDICYRRSPENLKRLAQAISPFKPRLRGLPPDLPAVVDERTLSFGTNFTLEIGDEALDLLGEMSGIGGYEQILPQVEEVLVEGIPVKVLSLQQLIATKQAAGRPKDVAALPLLRAALELKQGPGSPPDASPTNP